MQKVVFITGVSRGIGHALAIKFLKEGYSVIGTSTSGKVGINDKNLTLLKLDISSTKSIESCMREFLKLNKKIDILINNAGIWSGKEDDPDIDISLLRKVLEVNLIGLIDLCERLVPHINNSGKIINISSRAGSFNRKDDHATNYPKDMILVSYYADYRISKAALNMYTKALAKRLENRNIIVASIHPGWVKTDMGGSGADIDPEEAAENIYKRVVSLKETGQFWFKQEKFPW